MQSLAASFVPAADEVWRLHNRDGAECDLFRIVAEQGHYAGRTVPSDTRQGIYALAPSGRLLGSLNTRDPRRVARMLESALDAWAQLPEGERYLAPAPDLDAGLARRAERRYPEDGLRLYVFSRDLPRPNAGVPTAHRRARWKDHAWNQDIAWFRAEEAQQFLPRDRTVGATRDVPRSLMERFVRLHLLDHVRGQVTVFEPEDVELATFRSEVIAVEGPRTTLRIVGRTRARAPGRVAPDVASDSSDPLDHEHGVETQVFGEAIWNEDAKRFERFDGVALGRRWGGTRYNARDRDLLPQPIGFAWSIVPADEPPVAPAYLWKYGWSS